MSIYASATNTATEDEEIIVGAEDIQDIVITSQDREDVELVTAGTMDVEKRIRREIANSNERRRMQSINNGFQSLRSLLPHHEGEKLSKAAILQQTAEYIYSLEQEKTTLLSQNCQLKRLLHQQDTVTATPNSTQNNILTNSSNTGELPPKKRIKTEIITMVTTADDIIDDSTTINAKICNDSIGELQRQLEQERSLRVILEEQLRQYDTQIVYQHQQNQITSKNSVINTTAPTIYQMAADEVELLESTEEVVVSTGSVDDEDEDKISIMEDVVVDSGGGGGDFCLQVVTADSLPPVAQTQVVGGCCSPPDSRPDSPESLNNNNNNIHIHHHHHHPQFIATTVAPATSILIVNEKLPSVLEAAIKAEPKVEVERLPSPSPSGTADCDINDIKDNIDNNDTDDLLNNNNNRGVQNNTQIRCIQISNPQNNNNIDNNNNTNRLYASNTSRQNLETIVEAIRHLEGDHLFGDDPLILRNKSPLKTTISQNNNNNSNTHNLIKINENRRNTLFNTNLVQQQQQHQQQQQQQTRPGVIVVKQTS